MAKLSVVKASAGSGKTFQLTGNYLKNIFGNIDDFRHVLAVTFTNKATEEMKNRIIQELFLLSKGEPSLYIKELEDYTKLDEPRIREKAGIILKRILHNYSRFSVGTIDSFFQKIFRSFTREIGVQSGYNLELDTDKVLEEAVNRLFLSLDDDDTLRNWLTRYAEERIEEGKNWNFNKELLKLGREIYNEKYKQLEDEVYKKFKDKKFLDDYIKTLNSIKNGFESKLTGLSETGLELIQNNHLEIDDFSNKKSGPAGFLLKLKNKIYDKPGSRFQSAADNYEGWFTKTSLKREQIIDTLSAGLHGIAGEINDIYNSEYVSYQTANSILQNIYTLGILADITGKIHEYTNEHNLFILSDVSQFIHRIIDNNDAPFIYEKTGNYYHHYLIDEFQDTSGFQWENFKPLISNSLSENYSNLVVGDAKQSIYRWRNSDWAIFTKQINNDFLSDHIYYHKKQTNYRSSRNIVEFNNSLFFNVKNVLEEKFKNKDYPQSFSDEIGLIYNDVIQEFPKKVKEGGSVRIEFINEEEKTDDKGEKIVYKKVIDSIIELIDAGYEKSQIAILVRRRSEGREIAEAILKVKQENNLDIDVISDEALFLSNSSAVNFIIAVYKYLIRPEDELNTAYLAHEYKQYLSGNSNELKNIGDPVAKNKDYIGVLPPEFKEQSDALKRLSLYDLTEKIIQIFNLSSVKRELPYLLAFSEAVHNYVQNNRSDIYSFLDNWNDTKDKYTIPLSEGQNAIRILTIHKAKGLEFDAVIIPFVNWAMKPQPFERKILWCSAQQEPFNKLDILPVQYSANLKDTVFVNEYNEETLKTYIDNLNLLYVAFTRPRKALICFSQLSKKPESINNAGDLIYNVIAGGSGINQNKTIELYKHFGKERMIFQLGELRKDENKSRTAMSLYDQIKLHQFTSNNFEDKISIQRKSWIYDTEEEQEVSEKIVMGNIMHEIFRNIILKEDIKKAVDKVYYNGKIGSNERKELIIKIEKFITEAGVNEWFEGSFKILNEAGILLPSHGTKRPDRVIIKADEAIIVDYKFGMKKNEAYVKQVNEYITLLIKMGYSKVKGFLWYVNLNEVVKIKKG